MSSIHTESSKHGADHRIWLVLAIALAATLFLSACGADRTSQEPTPTTVPSAMTVTPTETPATATSQVVSEQVSPTPPDQATETPAPATPASTPTSEPSPTQPVEAEVSPFDSDMIGSEIDRMLDSIDGQVSVVVLGDDGGVLYEYAGDESMEAASIYKLPVMVEVFSQIEQGEISLDTGILMTYGFFNEGEDSIGFGAIDSYYDVESLLYAMITQSSNVAAYALLDLVGNERVNETMQAYGLDGIEIRWSPQFISPSEIYPEEPEESEEYEPAPDEEPPVEEQPEVDPDPPADNEPEQEEDTPEETEDEDPDSSGQAVAKWLSLNPPSLVGTVRADEAFNVVTGRAVADLLLMIMNGEVVSEASSAAMLDLLEQQQIPGGLPSALPAGTVAHKTGYLEDGVINDAGIISTPAGKVVAVVLTEGVREDIAYGLMSDIGLLLYEIGSTER